MILKEKALPRPRNQAKPPTVIAAILLVTFILSTNQATVGSTSEIADVIAAKTTNRKNKLPNN